VCSAQRDASSNGQKKTGVRGEVSVVVAVENIEIALPFVHPGTEAISHQGESDRKTMHLDSLNRFFFRKSGIDV